MADATSSRWMVIEDRDSRIHYSGSWFSDSYGSPGPYQAPGDITKGTARGTNTQGSFSVTYEGGSIAAWAISSHPPGNGVSVRCTLDGREAQSMLLGPGHSDGSLWTLCEGTPSTSGGTHRLVINITSNDNTVVWFENLTYLSLSNPDLSSGYSLITPDAAAVQYVGSGWNSDVNKEFVTDSEGSGFTVQFYGISIELRSFLLASMSRTASSATFSIDGGPERSFPLPTYVDGYRGLEQGKGRWRISTLSTPPVANGAHTLQVTYRGGKGQVPLTVDYFVVAHPGARVDATTNLGPPTSPRLGLGSQSQNTTASAPTVSGPPRNIGIIVGGSVAALALFALLVLLALLHRRHRRRLGREAIVYSEDLQETSQDLQFTPPTVLEKVTKGGKWHKERQKERGKYDAIKDDDDEDLYELQGGRLYDPQQTSQKA